MVSFRKHIPRGEEMAVFKKGKDWWIDFYHQGKRIRRKVGPSKKVAEMALADVQVKKAKKEFLGVCEPKRVLFKDFATEYLEYSGKQSQIQLRAGHHYYREAPITHVG